MKMKAVILPRMVAIGVAIATSCAAMSDYQLPLGIDKDGIESAMTAIKRVDVSIGVMSRCPDALFFENAFAKTLERVNQKINLSLRFIATPNSSSLFGASCKHGDEECQGNIHQLCVIDSLDPSKAGERYDIGPSAAQRLWWEFVQCENYVGGRRQIGQESLAKQCLKAIGGIPDWQEDGVEECAQGKRGRNLLKESIKEAHKQRIEKSATLLIEGEVVCVRDDNQWKDCSSGHETVDWVRQIEIAFERKNKPTKSQVQEDVNSFTPTISLYKRQAQNSTVPIGGPGLPPPTASSNTGTMGQGAPLSVFAIIKRLPAIFSSFFINDENSRLPRLMPLYHLHTSSNSKSSLFLQPRQSGGNNSSYNPYSANNNSPFNGSFPVPYLAFGIAAIALFVLVVAFVLLRIFVRNRRLRRMGIYPEGPIDRLLGGNFREFDDTLAPPRLWEAKITDINTGGMISEKAQDSSSDTKRHGWDALMPVSAALPPNLYPIIYQNSDKSSNAFEPPSTYPPPPSNQHTARLGRHMPQFLRRQTADAEPIANGPNNSSPSANATAGDFAAALSNSTSGEKAEEKLAASVNVTVLIAMPSSRTVFPSNRTMTALTSTLNTKDPLTQHSAAIPTNTETKMSEVEEDGNIDQDALSMKGKSRKAPSLRSVKSTTSLKSVAEHRREAFFSQITKDEAGKDIPSDAIHATPALPAYEEEEEELPELMFGTASVPIFTHLSNLSTSRRGSLTSASQLMQPSRADILELITAANKAREKKSEVEAAAGAKTKKPDEIDSEAHRISVAETSLDGEARSAGLNERCDDDTVQQNLGNVETRMLSTYSIDQSQDFEMTSIGPSRSYISDMGTPTTPTPLLSMASPFGVRTPTSSTPLNGPSGSVWHDDADKRT